MLEITRTHRVRMELDTTQIHHPTEPRCIINDDFFRSATRRKRQRHRAQPRRPLCRCTLLVERLAFGSIDKTFEDERTIANSRKGARRDRKVVADEIQLGELYLFGKVELVRVSHTDLTSVDQQHLGRTIFCHETTTL